MTLTTSPSMGATSSTCPVPVLLTAEEVAQALRVGRSKVYELMRSGALRSVKVGGSRRISATALAEFVASLEQSAA